MMRALFFYLLLFFKRRIENLYMINQNLCKIHDFIRKQKITFSTENVISSVFSQKKKITGAEVRSIRRWLKQYPDILELSDENWLVKEDLFKGSFFRVFPGALEWKYRALLPGQRMIPYLSSFLGHADCSFWDSQGKHLEKRYQQFSFEEVYSLLFLLPVDMWEGKEKFPDQSVIDFNTNTVIVPLYDLSTVLPKKRDEKASFIIEVLSSSRGEFKLHYVNGEDTQRQLLEASTIDARLEKEILEVIQKQSVVMSPDMLFLKALSALSPEDLKQTPGHPIIHLVMDSNLFLLHRSATGLISIHLNSKTVEVKEKKKSCLEPSNHEGVFESLDDIFSAFELSLSREELDSLAYGVVLMKWRKKEVIEKLLPERVCAFLYPEEKNSIYNEVKNLLLRVSRSLNKKSWTEEKKECICSITRFYFENIETLRKIDSTQFVLEEISEQAFIDNAEVTALLMSMLWILVEDESSKVPSDLPELLQIAKSSNNVLKEMLANHLSAFIH